MTGSIYFLDFYIRVGPIILRLGLRGTYLRYLGGGGLVYYCCDERFEGGGRTEEEDITI